MCDELSFVEQDPKDQQQIYMGQFVSLLQVGILLR